MKKKLILGVIIAIPVLFMACFNQTVKNNDEQGVAKDDLKVEETIEKPEILPEAVIKIKGYGEIKAELYPHKAPNTVNNFIKLAQNDFYDNLTIHRVVKDFVIQGGCPSGNGTGGPGYDIKGEFSQNGFTTNDIAHKKGVLSMARSSSPDSAGSQFFIMTDDAPHLDGAYAGFGMVTSGIEIVDSLNNVSVGQQDVPTEKVEIEDISINLNGYNAKEAIKTK
ncbi:MAG: peptidylprolyl isomerase [Sarcina sp.]